MRNKLVKQIRRSAKEIWSDSPYREYSTDARGNTVLTENCIKKLVNDTKRHLTHGAGQRLQQL